MIKTFLAQRVDGPTDGVLTIIATMDQLVAIRQMIYVSHELLSDHERLKKLEVENERLKDQLAHYGPTGTCEVCTSTVIAKYQEKRDQVEGLMHELKTEQAKHRNTAKYRDELMEKIRKMENDAK